MINFKRSFAAGYSEDSDYTSDLNYPITHPINSSTTTNQYRINILTPQRSLETSRENSYEKDDRGYGSYYDTMPSTALTQIPPGGRFQSNMHQSQIVPNDDECSYGSGKDESDPLFYNSRPMNSNNIKALNGSNRYTTGTGISRDELDAATRNSSSYSGE